MPALRTLEPETVRKATVEPAGVEVPILWRGRRARAFVPKLLAERDLVLGPDAVARAARAQAAVERGAESMPEDHVELARLLLRAEGVASSFIEGVTAPVVAIELAETSDQGTPSAAAWVAANLAAVTEALEEGHAGAMTIESLCGVASNSDDGKPHAVAPRRRYPKRAGMDRRDLATRRSSRDPASGVRARPS